MSKTKTTQIQSNFTGISEYQNTLKGILEINPILLEPGTFYNTNTKQLSQVGARIGAKAKIKHHFNIAVKQTRLKNIDLF